MINNLFSIFNPSSISFIPLNWISSIFIILFIPIIFWNIPSRSSIIIQTILNFIKTELIILLKNNNIIIIICSIFIIISLNNFLGLIPFVFTRTSHLSFNLTFSIPIWLGLILYGWINNNSNIFIHLIPQRTPTLLIPFIVIIETIRNLIRPITLSVRLTANIIAGHLLLTLIRRIKYHLSIPITIPLILTQSILISLEISVSLIQAYVFSILATLYCKEV